MSKSQATERLVALLFTDLVDSAKLNARLGDVRFQKVMVQHNKVWRDLSTQHRGRGQRTTGDGFSAMFDQPLDAVRFAMAFHAALERLSDELQLKWEGRPLRLTARAGIHLGNIVAKDQDEPQGLAFGIANRVMSPGVGGQTLMTIASFNIARRSAVGVPTETNLVWLEHGLYSFKGFDEPMTICEVGIEGRSPLRPPPDSEKVKRTVTPDQDETLGWRPAKDSAVPHNPQWILREPLGAGGFGEVWLAENKTLDIERVFKFCFDTVRLRALKRELSIFKLLRGALGEHPNIQRLDDVNIQEPPPYYLVMDYARGGNLASWSESEQYGGIGNIPLGDRLELVAQVADGLGAAHAVGVIHKDVKPGNILIGNEPGRGIQARLADFGIGLVIAPELAERLDIHLTGWEKTDLGYDLGSRTGTRLYTAPELVAGRDPSIQSDIYSLGVVLYQVVIGDFSRPLAEGWKEGIADELLCEDIEACVHGDPKRRLRAAEDLAERLRTLEKRRRDRHDRQVEAERVRVESERRERQIRRLRRLAVVCGLAIPAAILMTVPIMAWRAERDKRQAQEVLTTLFTDPVASRDKLKEGGERLRTIVGELGSAYLHSTEPFPKLGARLWSFLPEPLAASFWSSVDGGALWRHGGWLELCSEEPSVQRVPFAQLEEKTWCGTEREKYVAFCLIGHFSPAEEKWRDLCTGAIENEAHPGVIAAARWAAQRLGADVTMKSGDRVYVDEVTGMTFVHVPGTERFFPGAQHDHLCRLVAVEIGHGDLHGHNGPVGGDGNPPPLRAIATTVAISAVHV
ncbi:MAG: protein kinase [Planctomycetes bacterium]|nr:protein kinase [Planctomycetota bacterium]